MQSITIGNQTRFQGENFKLNGVPLNQEVNHQARKTRCYFFLKLLETASLHLAGTTVRLACRTVKLITWVPLKTSFYAMSGFHTESSAFCEHEYLNTVKALRDVLFIPSVAKRAFMGMTATREEFVDDLPRASTTDYLKVKETKSFQQFSSYLYGCKTFEVISPEGVSEIPAAHDPTLKTVMASHLFQPDLMAINFGSPNVAAFVTEESKDGSVQTLKVDAKSLYREPMSFHPTNGKIQSGVFLVPTNLPKEALERFKAAATKMAGREDVTCVNTNCRVLSAAGFSIEGVSMDAVVFPNTLIEHLLFRHVFYTDLQGKKHKVHFDILNTTKQNLEDYFKDVDTAVVGTRLRHNRRHADTEENQRARGEAAKALIAEEASRLANMKTDKPLDDAELGKRKITVSVPSSYGDALACFWGRHTIYEVDLSDKAQEISDAFQQHVNQHEEGGQLKLRPFSQEKPNFVTRLKRDLFFSGPVIRFLRRHMMGRVDAIHLHTQDIFKHLKSTKGAHLNYVLLDDKIVLARVNANGDKKQIHRKGADWALSKHALLSGRKEVYCSGEIWYDETKKCFIMNDDSGTYQPTAKRVELAAELANRFFEAKKFQHVFQAASVNGVESEEAEAESIKSIINK
ncbi:MAG: hypothetical protein ACH350_08075 [Parachlamydiaceae bacterium]